MWKIFEPSQPNRPHIILVVGVNGVSKTTTIGKLSHQFKKNGFSVVLGAADTFRAAAVDQLKIWSERSNANSTQRDEHRPCSSI